MKPTAAGAAALAAALLLLAQPARRAPAQQPSGAARRYSAVFLVTREGTPPETQVEPVAVVDGAGKITGPESNPDGGGALPDFLARHYRPGEKYRVIYGGAEAGTLTIRAAAPAECSPNDASADINSASVQLGGNVMALATDGAHAPRKQISRRAPTPAERAAAFDVVKRFLGGKRVSASAVARGTKTLNLTATDLDGDGREELVGSYVVKVGPQVRDTLFLIAAQQGRGFVPIFTKYARVSSRDMMDPSLIDDIGEGGLGAELYIEQLDADGDGVGEVFTYSRSFEGTTFRAYQRQGGTWRETFENYSYRCAY